MDQLLFNRPVPGYAQYRAPVTGHVHVRLEHASGRRSHGRARRKRRARRAARSRAGRIDRGISAFASRATTASSSAAGHNGLVCAASWRAAADPCWCSRPPPQVGGAAVTREFAPGFRVSAGAHLLHLMPAELMRDLRLEIARSRMGGAAHADHGAAARRRRARPWAGGSRASGLSAADAQAYAGYTARMRRFAAALAPMFARVPPRLGTTAGPIVSHCCGIGWQIRRLGRRDMRELLRIVGMNVYDLLEENFESAALKGALGFDAVLGANFGPRSPGTVLTLLYRLAAESRRAARGCRNPRAAWARCAMRSPRRPAPRAPPSAPARRWRSILIEGDRACGVVLESGETIGARSVISSCRPEDDLPEAARAAASRHRLRAPSQSHSLPRARRQTASGAEPRAAFPRCRRGGAARPAAHRALARVHRARLQSCEVRRILRRAGHGDHGSDARTTRPWPRPASTCCRPSCNMRRMRSRRVGRTDGSASWTVALDTLERFAPGLRGSIVGAELLTPADMEQEFRISGGHWHHGDLAFDQFLMVRPVPGAAQYRTPVDGLFLCGAGCHPGGGVMGIAGRNAAQAGAQGRA